MAEICSPFVSSRSTQKINGRVYPNGRFGYAVEKESKTPPVNDRDLRSTLTEDEEFNARQFRMRGLESYSAIARGDSPPGLSNVPNSHKSKTREKSRGSKGLTARGRRLIFNGLDYLTWRFGRRSLSFATVTIPSVSPEMVIEITKEWANICRTFIQRIGRKLNEQNLPSWIVGAYEVQVSRLNNTGNACLHFHFCFVGRVVRGPWRVAHDEVRSAWRSAIVSRIPTLSDCDWSACENVQPVRKNVAAYLAKYLSKGSGNLGDVATFQVARPPCSWYTCSLELRRIVDRNTRYGRAVGSILSGLSEEAFITRKAVKIKDSNDQEFIVGWYGVLRPGWSQHFHVPVHIPIEESNDKVNQFRFPKVLHDGYCSVALNVV